MSRFTRLASLSLVAAVLPVAAATASSAPTETVRFNAVGGSGVKGSATLGANGIGTKVAVRVTGLEPGSTARVLLHVGRYPKLSASFARAAGLRADARGAARATSAVRYRSEPVSWTVVADGDHVLTIVAGGKVVAWAAIPGMD